MKRFVLLSILAYGLLLLGLASLQPSFVALSIPIALYLLAGLIRGPDELKIQVRRRLSSSRVGPGEAVQVHVTVTNLGGLLEEAHLEEILPEGLTVQDGEANLLTTLANGESAELSYTLCSERGMYRFEGIRITARDLLGVFQKQTVVGSESSLLVLPEAARLRRVGIRPLRTHGFAGPIPARESGPGVEFYGVREYERGDPLRWINWKMTARHPRFLYTNEFEQERVADVGLILDARSRTNVTFGRDSLLERGILATASLAQALLQDGNRVGLLIYGWYLDWTFPGYGKVQHERILRALARAKLGESLLFDTLDYLPVRHFPSRSQIVVVSPLCDDDYPMLFRLRARGYHLLLVSPNPVKFEAEHMESTPGAKIAVQIAALNRNLLLARLRRAGVRVVDWDVNRPLDQAIHGALRVAPHVVHNRKTGT